MYRKVLCGMLLVVVLLASVGCGGGNSGDSQQDSGSSEQADQAQQGNTDKQENNAASTESTQTVRGVVAKFDTEKNILWVKIRGKETTRSFQIIPESLTKVISNGEATGPDAIERGQRVAVTFIKKAEADGEPNTARRIRINATSGG